MCIYSPKSFMKKSVNGMQYTLYLKTDIEQAIAFENALQNRLNEFRNIRTEPYTGRKYKKDLFVWLVIG